MEPMTVRELLAATDGKLLGDVSLDTTISGVETDSRAVHDGDLFVAIRGENIDGHQFITGALEGGALGCLTAVPPKEAVPGKFYVLVEDTVQALGQVARVYKAKFPIPVIGITGSVGKTTTKDMIASVLSQKFRVLKTEGNYNNEIGLPLTLFRLNPQHELCVLEMGMNHFGEIDYLTRIVSPNVAVITNIGDAHIENLGSREGILKAKSEIFQAMTGDDLAVLNGDDPLLRTLEGKIAPGILWCGADHEPPYEAKEIRQMGAKGLQCKIKTPKTEFAVTIPALGNHMIYPVLMACAIGEKFGMTGEEMKKGVEAFVPTKMRMNVIRQGDVTILDDAYNANPQSMRAALEAVPAGQMEAGYCVGMSYLQIIRRIVLPQALRTAFPPLSNSLISMVKDTSLAANITVMEMFMATQRIAARTYEMLPLYCEVAAIYLLFSTILTFIQRAGERRLSSYGKRDGKRKA